MAIAGLTTRIIAGELGNVALVSSDPQGTRLYGRDLGMAIGSTSAALLESFVGRKGDRVVLQAGNSVEQAVVSLAIMAAGRVLVPVSPDAGQDDLDWIMKSCEPQGYVYDCGHGSINSVPNTDIPTLMRAGERNPAESVHPGTEPDDVAAIVYTSGSTARPKGVCLTRRNLETNARALTQHLGLTANDVHLCVLPMYHSNALHFSLITALLNDSTVVIAPALPLRGCAKLISQHGVTHISAAPQAVRLMMRDPLFHASHMPTLRTIVTASAPLPRALCESFTDKTGIRLVQGYGLTECTNFATMTPPNPPAARYEEVMLSQQVPSAGMPLPNTEVTIERPQGNDLSYLTDGGAQARVGEVVIRGPQVSPGYWGSAELGGVLRTGDLGYLRKIGDDEYLFLVGRIKEIAIRNGENHSLRQIDDELTADLADLDYASIGLSDEQVGDEIALCVHAAPDLAQRVIEAIRKVSATRRPRLLILLNEPIPRTATGKIKRSSLRRLMDDFTSSSGPGRSATVSAVIDLRRPTKEGR